MKEPCYKAIHAKLSATSGVTSLLSAATEIYILQAPQSAQEPYIVMTYAAGGDDNDTPTTSGDLRFQIKAVAVDTDSYSGSKRADDIAEAIRTALHEQQAGMVIDSPYAVYRMQHLTPFEMIENIKSVQYYHSGGIYRMRISV